MENSKKLQFGKLYKFAIWKIPKNCNSENYINLQFGKFEKLSIWKIWKISQILQFQKWFHFWNCSIPKNSNFENLKNFKIKIARGSNVENSKNLQLPKLQEFPIWNIPKIFNSKNFPNFTISKIIQFLKLFNF